MLTIFQINTELTRFIEMTPKNHVDQLTVFDAPLVAVAAADDPLFARMQQADAVGSGHWLPTEWLPGARAVVSYFLPFSAAVRQANRAAGMPAREWMIGRYEGEQCNAALRAHMVAWFNAHGVPAVAPSSDARLTVVERRSNWSERHVAYIAGLGTFSLSRSLITKQGSAGRLGSFVLALPLAATARDYATREEYCSHCGACIYRCPPLAITEQGKDNLVCAGYLDRVLARGSSRATAVANARPACPARRRFLLNVKIKKQRTLSVFRAGFVVSGNIALINPHVQQAGLGSHFTNLGRQTATTNRASTSTPIISIPLFKQVLTTFYLYYKTCLTGAEIAVGYQADKELL